MQSVAKPTSNSGISRQTWGLLLILGALWGGSFFFARVAVQEVPPLWLVFFRVMIAACALHIYLVVRAEWHLLHRAPIVPFLILGLLNNAIPFSLIFAGQKELGAGLASILNATNPFLTVIAAHFLTRDEKVSFNKIAGTLIGILGAVVIIGPSALTDNGAPLWAQLAIIGAAVSYTLAVIYAKRFKHMPPVVTATGQLTASTIIMLPTAYWVHGVPQLSHWHSQTWLAVIALAIGSTAFAYTLYFKIIASAGATTASLVTLIVPISAVLLGNIFLGETLSWAELGGMVLIGIGLLTINRSAFLKAG